MTIDWSKPLRTIPSGIAATTAIVNGQRVVSWEKHGKTIVYHVDEDGYSKANVQYGGFRETLAGTPRVENVPEEPKDHVLLYRDEGKWKVDSWGGGQQLNTEKHQRDHAASLSIPAVIVKVPV